MPTGYTYIVEKDCTFSEYLLKCAEAFLIESRDKNGNDPIPREIKPEYKYNKDKLDKWEGEMKQLKSLTKEGIIKKINKEALGWSDREIGTKLDYEKERRQYQSMIDQVNDWTPPTGDHKELKKFMLSQLELCIIRKPYEISKYEVLTPKEWIKEKKESIQRDIDYHKKGLKNDKKRADQRNEWVKPLFDYIDSPTSNNRRANN